MLHNNVGIVAVGGPVEASEESWDRVNDVNLKSMFLTCKQVLPHMERQGKGAIVNIASVSEFAGSGFPTSPMRRPRQRLFSSPASLLSNTPGQAYERTRSCRG